MKCDICLTFRQWDDQDRFPSSAQDPFGCTSQESLRDEAFSMFYPFWYGFFQAFR